ncbi:MAG: PKD domain-containing protein [Bacteroidales bacterium]|nr:PKD domain-containing protein [Bacteroidales bacterium]
MKRLALILLVLPLILTSCRIEPVAGFFTSEVVVEVGDEVYFTNNSLDARYFEWDFGDGTSSTDVNPIHIYTASGTYTITLSAISKRNHIDRAYQDITVLFPTTLEIEVLEYYDEYPVENASVILYPTYDDWLAETDMIIEGFTNNNGIVIFSRMDPAVYYVDVWEQNHNNYTLADDDIEWIRIPQLEPNEINRFVAWVDYVSSKGGERNRQLKIKKLERKYTDKKK